MVFITGVTYGNTSKHAHTRSSRARETRRDYKVGRNNAVGVDIGPIIKSQQYAVECVSVTSRRPEMAMYLRRFFTLKHVSKTWKRLISVKKTVYSFKQHVPLQFISANSL